MSKSPSRERETIDDARKVFITNIDGAQPQQTVEVQLRKLFDRFGPINRLNVKKNKNGLYSFAFLQFDKADAAHSAIKQFDQYELFGKRMRVYKDNYIRRQDRQSEGCFHCKKTGHFARECPENKEDRQHQPKEYNNRPRYNRNERGDRYQKERDSYREGGYDRDRYHSDRDRGERRYRDQRDRRDYEYRRHRRSPSRSRSKQYRNRRQVSSSSERDRRYQHHSDRRYYERDSRGPREDRHRDDHRRRRERSRSRSHSRSRSRSQGR